MEQNTDRWLEWRRQGIGSSDAAIIMGVSPYKTPFQLWEEKLGLNNHDDSGSNFVKDLGHKFEKSAKADLNLELEANLQPECVEHNEFDWLRASFDAIDLKSRVFAEIKYVGAKKFDWIKENQKPLPEHWPQVMHQFLISGFEKGYYVAYTLTDDRKKISRIERVKIEPDIEYIKKMFKHLKDFWNKVQNQVAPPLSDKDVKTIKKRPDLESEAEMYFKLKDSKKRIEEIMKLIEARISVADNHPVFQVGPMKVQKVVRKGAVEYKKIPELKQVNLDQYRKQPSTFFKFSEVESGEKS